jgi:hypothetical protein
MESGRFGQCGLSAGPPLASFYNMPFYSSEILHYFCSLKFYGNVAFLGVVLSFSGSTGDSGYFT